MHRATQVFRAQAAQLSQARLLHSTARASLPRLLPRSRVAVESSLDDDASSSFQAPPGAQPASDPALPWFLELDPIQIPTVIPSSSSAVPIVSLPEPTQDLAPALADLRKLILTSSLARLLAPAEDGVEPLRFIHARKIDFEGAWCEWIVIVEVEGSAGGAVASMAKLCGEHLKHALPPRDETEEALDLLGAPRVRRRKPEPSKPAPQRPPGMPRASFAAGKSLEPWRIEKLATADRGPWQPRRIISREAQVGMRLLASSDPSWDAVRLATHFKISPEAARRILRSKWQAPGHVVGRQNRRALEREEAGKKVDRQEEEMNAIWKELGRQPDGASASTNAEEAEEDEELEGEKDEQEEEEEEAPFVDAALSTSGSSPRHTQPVQYEGLVGPSGSDTPMPRKGTPASRGDGEWCVVDAEWCVVHVMTTRARAMYDVESRWQIGGSKRADDGARSMTGRNAPSVPRGSGGSKKRYAVRDVEDAI